MKRFLQAISIVSFGLTSLAQAEISYAEILADPDNPALNQQFARERLATGDAKAALAAVERVLVAEPINLSARLFRAEVLAALGADLQAKGELQALASLPLPQDIQTRVVRLQDRIAQRAKRVRTQVNLSIGYLENDNATGWPTDDTVLFQGNPEQGYNQEGFGTQSSITEKTKDDSLSQTAAVTSTYDLGRETWRDVFVSASHSANRDSDTKYLDNEVSAVGIGLTYKRGRLTLSPRASSVEVDNEFAARLGNYKIEAASFGGHFQLANQRRLTGSLGRTRLSFEGDKNSNNTLTHSGSLGYEMALAKAYLLNARAFSQDIDSFQNRDLDKKMAGLSLSLRMGLKLGHFITVSGSYSESHYDHVYSQSYHPTNQTPADGTKREDEMSTLGVSYLLLGSAVSPRLNNLFFNAGYSHSDTQSNIVGFGQKRDIGNLSANYILRF